MKRILFLAFAVILGMQVSAQVQVDSIVDPATFPELSIVSDANARLLSKNGGTWNLVLPSSLQSDVENGWGVVSPDSTGNITWLGRFKRNNADQKLYFTDFEGDRVLIHDPAAIDASLNTLSISNDTLNYTQNDGTTGFIVLPSGGGGGGGSVWDENTDTLATNDKYVRIGYPDNTAAASLSVQSYATTDWSGYFTHPGTGNDVRHSAFVNPDWSGDAQKYAYIAYGSDPENADRHARFNWLENNGILKRVTFGNGANEFKFSIYTLGSNEGVIQFHNYNNAANYTDDVLGLTEQSYVLVPATNGMIVAKPISELPSASGGGVIFQSTEPSDTNSIWVDNTRERASLRIGGAWQPISREFQFTNIDSIISNELNIRFQDGDVIYNQAVQSKYFVSNDTFGYYLDSVYCIPLDNGKYAKMYFENGVVEVAKGEPLADITTPGDDTELVLKAIRQCNLSRQRSLRFDGDYYFDPRVADFDIGRQNTSTATGQPLLVEINGTLIGDTTFQINSYVHLKGDESNNLGTQFQYGGASSMGVNDYDPATTDTIPTLMILGNGINTIENLVFPYTDSYYGGIAIGSERDSIGCSNVSLKNVGVLMSDHPNAVGIKLYSTFWVWMEEIAVNAIGPVDTGIPPSSRAAIEIRENKSSNGTSSGFRYMENMVLNNGPLMISGDNDGTVGTHIESVDFENMRGSNLIIDTRSINFLGNLTFQQFTDHDRPSVWVGQPLVKILGNKARNIVFRDWSNDLKVEGYCDNCQFINTDRPFEYSSPNEQFKTGETVDDGTMSFNFGQYDGKVTQLPISTFSSVMPGTPFPSLPYLGSELAALSSDSLTITAGFAGPNQDNEAVFCEPQIVVDASNPLRVLDQSGYTFRNGELLLVSAWVRSACDTCFNQRFENKAIFRISTDASGVTFNEVGTGISSSNRLVNDPITGVTGQGWHLVSKVFEVSNPSSSTGRVILDLLYSQQDFYLYRPALVSLDESNNYTTRDLHRIAQTFSYYDDRANKGDYSIPGKRALLDGHYLVGLDLPFGTGNNRAVYVTTDSTLSDMPMAYDPVNNTVNFFLAPPYSAARVNYRNTNASAWLVQMQTTFNATNVNMQWFDGTNLNSTQEHFIRNFIGSNQSTNKGAYYGFHQNPEVGLNIPDSLNAFYIRPIGSPGNFEFNGVGDFVLPTDGGIRFANDGVSILNGDSSPDLNESAPVGSLYLRRSGSTNPLYVKTTGTDSLGWAPVLVDPQVQTLTASGTYSKGSSHVVLDGTSAGVVLTLEATPSTGCKILEVVAKDITNAVSIDGNGNNINGAATYTFSAAYEGVTLFFDGTEWYAY